MKIKNTIVVILPAVLLMSGCSMLPGANNQDIPQSVVVVPEIESIFGKGDTLWYFAERTTGDGENWKLIKAYNEIEDETDIDAGIMLLVPRELALDSLKGQ